MKNITTYEELEKKIAEAREMSPDLSTEEDLAIAIMNLISLEEHLFFSGSKTGKGSYYDLLDEVREMRKSLLARMLPETEGEVWCVSKHLLAASMRLIEVGTKLRSSGDKKGAEETFQKAFRAFNLFFAVRLGITKVPKDVSKKPMTLDEVMGGLLNCCKE